MRYLFVSWDGPEQDYMAGLFLPILRRLSRAERSFIIAHFTWGEDTGILAEQCREAEVEYQRITPARFRPLAASTSWSILRGAHTIRSLARRFDADLLLPRSHIPGAMSLLATRSRSPRPIVWDSDGFMPDERVEFGGWSTGGVPYRVLRAVERRLSEGSLITLARTRRGREVLEGRRRTYGVDTPPPIHVVTNGRDSRLFRPGDASERRRIRREWSVPEDAPWVVYVGSAGPQYRPDAIAALLRRVLARRPDTHFLGLTGTPEALDSALRAENIRPEQCQIARVAPEQVASPLRAADLGISFRVPTLSQSGVAPVKIGEYLLSGLPVVTNQEIPSSEAGPGTEVLRLAELTDEALTHAVRWFESEILPQREVIRENARARGLRSFSLDQCVQLYREALDVAERRWSQLSKVSRAQSLWA